VNPDADFFCFMRLGKAVWTNALVKYGKWVCICSNEKTKGFKPEPSGNDVSSFLCLPCLKRWKDGGKVHEPMLFVICLLYVVVQYFKLEPLHVKEMTVAHQVA